MLNLIPEGWLFVICHQSYNGHVISKFDNGVVGVDGATVMGEEGVEEGNEDIPLCCASVQDDVRPPILMFCGLLLRKSSIQVDSKLPKPSLLSL